MAMWNWRLSVFMPDCLSWFAAGCLGAANGWEFYRTPRAEFKQKRLGKGEGSLLEFPPP